MLTLHVSTSDLRGGACRAAYRIHRCIREHSNENEIDSRMRVIEKLSDDGSVVGGPPLIANPIYRLLQKRLAIRNRYGIKFQTKNSVHHSFAWPSTGLGQELNQMACDIIHLHWVGHMEGHDTLSVREIGMLSKPVVWTLHDQWPFCGAEHYVSPPPQVDDRFIAGYLDSNRPIGETGKDRNQAVWMSKLKYWKTPFNIVCPSRWMAECAAASRLMARWPVTVIPYPIDLERWAPLEQGLARQVLNLPMDRQIILLCADGGARDPRKGAHLLAEALQKVDEWHTEIADSCLLLILGQEENPTFKTTIPTRFAGRLTSDLELRLHYAAADVVVIPSIQDNLPLVGIEAHACGTPVVGFNIGGLPDIISHEYTGALAEPLDPASLAKALIWVLQDKDRHHELSTNARNKAEDLWSPGVVSKQYCKLYEQIIPDKQLSGTQEDLPHSKGGIIGS